MVKKILKEEVDRTAVELRALPKGRRSSVLMVWWLRRRMTVTLRGVGERLDMGHCARVTQAVIRVERRAWRRVIQPGDRLLRSLDGEAP